MASCMMRLISWEALKRMRRFFTWLGNHFFSAFLGAAVTMLISVMGIAWVEGLFAAATESWQAFVTWFLSDVPVPRWVLFLVSILLLGWLWIYFAPRFMGVVKYALATIEGMLGRLNSKDQDSSPRSTMEPSLPSRAFGPGPGAAALQRALEANPKLAASTLRQSIDTTKPQITCVARPAAGRSNEQSTSGLNPSPNVYQRLAEPNLNAKRENEVAPKGPKAQGEIGTPLLERAVKHAEAAKSSILSFSFEEEVLLTVAILGPSPVNEQSIIRSLRIPKKGSSVRLALIMLKANGMIVEVPGPNNELTFWTLTGMGFDKVRALDPTY